MLRGGTRARAPAARAAKSWRTKSADVSLTIEDLLDEAKEESAKMQIQNIFGWKGTRGTRAASFEEG